jgi:putative colanic acid biosynthesis acetyltransferase WcaF
MKIDLQKSKSPFTLKVKLLRLIWNTCWFLVKHLPRPASKLRIYLLRAFGAKVGGNCLIEKGVKIWIPWNLEISDFVAIGRNVEIYNYGKVTIGSMTVISQYSYLCTGSHDYTHSHMPLIWEDINIGSECWIASGSWIIPGVSIGNGSIIGARSLVTKNMPAWMVCAGHPCVPIKERIVG